MKNVLFALVIITMGCSHASNDTRKASNSSSSETPLSRPNLPDEAQPNQPSSTPQVEKEFAEAEEIANKFWQATVIQCNQEYYYATWNSRNFQFRDCRYKSGPENTGQTNSPRVLSEAEMLNGVDPLPIKYEGRSVITLQTCREWNQGFGDSWGQWYDLTHELDLDVTKTKNGWTTQPHASDGQLSKITCAQVKVIDSRYKGAGLRPPVVRATPARQ